MKAKRSPVLYLLLGAAACGGSDLEQTRADVAEAGSSVMPFDLERTSHFFERLENGGLQTVRSDDGDGQQVTLIRTHLADEAQRFAEGDFHDPAMIHGEDMAGLHELVVGHDRLTVTYREVEQGAEILYESQDSSLVAAIHAWFDAQLRDHGDHAQGHR